MNGTTLNETPPMLIPCVIAGGIFGVLSGLPLVGAVNCACCALVVGGGVLAAFLYSRSCRDAGVPFTPGRGALVGLVAGLVHAVVATTVSTVVNFALGNFGRSLEEMNRFTPPDPEAAEVIHRITEIMESIGPAGMILVGLALWIVLGAIFSTIGGLIGGAMFKVEGSVEPVAGLEGDPVDRPPIG
jgi:hypothetical protein